jgi:hypothetical protein
MHDTPPSGPSSDKKPPRPAQPYLDWARATGFSYLRDGAWIPLLIEFDPKAARTPRGNEKLTALEAFATRRWLNNEPRTLDEQFIVPELFSKPSALLSRSSDFNFCIGLIRRDAEIVRSLTSSEGWTQTIRRLELGPPIDFPSSASAPLATPGPTALETPRLSTMTKPRNQGGRNGQATTWLRRGLGKLCSWFGGSSSADTPTVGAPSPLPSPSTLPPAPPPSGSSPSTIPPAPPGSPGSGLPPSPVPPISPPGPGAGGGAAGQITRVVVAVIDQGIAFVNSRFFSAGQSRIEYLWQQNMLGTTVPAPSLTMSFTPGFELNRVAIQNSLAAAKLAGGDEDWIYRNFGGLNHAVDGYKPLARRRTHGTHVLDLAAGNLSAAAHPIIAIDLPEDAVGDPAGSTLAVQAAWGLIYALDRAASLCLQNETLPVVANISYGPHEGPHDGSALFETFMDQLWQLANGSSTPLEIVLAAGNFKQTRTHAEFALAGPARSSTLQWRLQPGSLSPSLMEIWLPQGANQQITVTLTPPVGNPTLPPISVSPAQPSNAIPAGGGVLYWAQYVAATVLNGADSIVLGIARTAPDPAGGWGSAVAPSGVWGVTLSSSAAMQGIKAWIKRSDTLSGRRAKGRQSYFDDPGYPRFWPNGRPYDFDPPTSTSYVRRIQTLSGIATGDKTRVIGGYRDSDFYPARYSSNGTRSVGGVPTGPDWLECSDESDVLHGVLAAATRSGSVVAMNGTSVAAPQATRWIAQAWLGLNMGNRPPVRAGLKAPNIPPQRPIPPADLAAIGNRLAPFVPRQQRRR